MKWKNEYNYTIIAISAVFFISGAVFSLSPFFYSKEFLVNKTQEDLNAFMKTDKILEDSRFTFLKKENGISCAYSKYISYAICKGGMKWKKL